MPGEVTRFNESIEFRLRYEVSPPETIDSEHETATKVGFVVTSRNGIFPESTYCLYTLFKDQALHAYIGLYENSRIETRQELEALANFQEGASALYDWLRALVKEASARE